MSLIITADLHFTDNPRDEHRWALLPWLAKQGQAHKAEAVLLLGDLTDAKDKHSAALTNRMVRGLTQLADQTRVIAIRGNHDCIDEAEPFFGFMDGISRDTGGRIQFLIKPTIITFKSVGECLFLPNTRDYQADWFGPVEGGGPKWGTFTNYIFTHQTYDGCLTENGTRLDGIPPSVFKSFKGKVISGDIHKPQKVSRNIEYVGAPYRCRFGDDYTPRVLLLNDDGTTTDLHFPTKDKHLIKLYNYTLADALGGKHRLDFGHEVYEGDQIKVRVELTRAQMQDWPAIKQEVVDTAARLGLELTGPEAVVLPDAKPKTQPKEAGLQGQTGPQGHVAAYAVSKGASEALAKAGQVLLAKAVGRK